MDDQVELTVLETRFWVCVCLWQGGRCIHSARMEFDHFNFLLEFYVLSAHTLICL